jgi:ribosomal protein S18 acetylase RimI-like enzyme
MLKIRRYRASDHDAVWDLHNLALNQVGAHGGNGSWDEDLHHIESVYLEAGGEFVVGTIGGRIVAMGGLQCVGRGHAAVKRMRVHPDFQRRGFGQTILRALEGRAMELGYRHLSLDTTTGQTAAQALYARNGYAAVGRDRYGPFELILYEKELSPSSSPRSGSAV